MRRGAWAVQRRRPTDSPKACSAVYGLKSREAHPWAFARDGSASRCCATPSRLRFSMAAQREIPASGRKHRTPFSPTAHERSLRRSMRRRHPSIGGLEIGGRAVAPCRAFGDHGRPRYADPVTLPDDRTSVSRDFGGSANPMSRAEIGCSRDGALRLQLNAPYLLLVCSMRELFVTVTS